VARRAAGYATAKIAAGCLPVTSRTITARAACRHLPCRLNPQLLNLTAWTVGEYADRAHTDHDLAGGRTM